MRPPRGYDQNDKPLPHEFLYETGLSINDGTYDSTMFTYLRTSKISVDPSTIEVHRKNASFSVDAGPLICYDSIVPEIEIIKSYVYDYGAKETSKLGALLLQTLKIFGHHKDTWDAIDPLSASTPQTIFEVVKDDTNEDVIPVFGGNKMKDGLGQPLSDITGAEVYGDYGLTTNALIENVSNVLNSLDTAEHYKIIANKLKTMHGPRQNYIMSPQRPAVRIYEKRRTPKQVSFADEDLFYGEFLDTPIKSNSRQITNTNISTTAISHVFVRHKVRFNEWNKDFDQRRM